ncbi:hypothetical protein Z959_08890 [Clostridium novyi B str. ATCC 27606]|uniref:Uncharacterized protein n=2 Tax=Clostridium TaxID=1485 RepID=A0AA40IUC3_CLONO|nr:MULTISPECIES: hypothetical protein [Clostridium]KEI14303.1 hypothetical protein Z958_00675 [Clostridium novyi B str. NCTC 9691]KEI16797.1 hypothetical protein Z959_08890 [Clostridium novyi B str. ATCC 27606]KEI17815.1 hypothetical protein Z960_05415 [Clostridium haemolyticum NCTC 9693]KGN00022.1 hypothetical protein Z961_11230 [Clostridium haemolyticum NCTC 8350]OOB75913.1 hypothetical protein AXF41_05945 [Clostridium haemolyticum]
MTQRLLLKTGTLNIKNISKNATEDTTVTGTTPSNATLESISINLQNPSNSVLLSGSVDFSIYDTTAGSDIGPLLLNITRTVNGDTELVYQTEFYLTGVNYLDNLEYFDNFSFEWLDSNPISSICSNMCSDVDIDCPNTTITYNFIISNDDGFLSATQTGGVVIDDYYSLTIAEVSK